MKDSYGREINYIRISVTDRCNLRCRYCMPPEGVRFARSDKLLTFGEIVRIADICGRMGVVNIRLTGGEPLVRKDISFLIRELKSLPATKNLRLTTNGILLSGMLGGLAKAGLDGVNISLDTLDREKYRMLTGYDGLEHVRDAVKKALDMGCFSVKTNTVMLAGINDSELPDIAAMACNDSLMVRFIEVMPIGLGKKYAGISAGEVMKRISQVFGRPVPSRTASEGCGPAVYYRFPGLKGQIGFISPLSEGFCPGCNKIRLTAEGRLKPCLQYGDGYDLRQIMRKGCTDDDIAALIQEAVMSKPLCHHFEEKNLPGEEKDLMSQIGG